MCAAASRRRRSRAIPPQLRGAYREKILNIRGRRADDSPRAALELLFVVGQPAHHKQERMWIGALSHRAAAHQVDNTKQHYGANKGYQQAAQAKVIVVDVRAAEAQRARQKTAQESTNDPDDDI